METDCIWEPDNLFHLKEASKFEPVSILEEIEIELTEQ